MPRYVNIEINEIADRLEKESETLPLTEPI